MKPTAVSRMMLLVACQEAWIDRTARPKPTPKLTIVSSLEFLSTTKRCTSIPFAQFGADVASQIPFKIPNLGSRDYDLKQKAYGDSLGDGPDIHC